MTFDDIKTIVGIGTPIIGGLVAAISVLWSRVDKQIRDCLKDKVDAEASHAKAYKDRDDERAKENKEWFDRVEGLRAERTKQDDKMMTFMIDTLKKSEEGKYDAIRAMTDFSRAMVSLEQAVTRLTDKLDERRA